MALEYWRYSIRYNKSNPLTNIALAKYFKEKNNLDSVHFHLENLSTTVTLSAPAEYFILGKSLMELGDTVKAHAFFDKYRAKGNDSMIIKQIEAFKSVLK
jgi:hypothetical protein